MSACKIQHHGRGEGPDTESCDMFLKVIAVAWDTLLLDDRRSLRGVCHDVLRAADRQMQCLAINDFSTRRGGAPPPSAMEVRTTVQRFLARGGMPEMLVLRLSTSRLDATSVGMGALEAFSQRIRQTSRAFSLPSHLWLQGVPLSPDLIRAVSYAAPSLKGLKLNSYALEFAPQDGGEDGEGAASSSSNSTDIPGPACRALSLGLAAVQLKRLSTDSTVAAAALEALTGLTHLTLQRHYVLPVLPALLGMRGLAELYIPAEDLCLEDVGQHFSGLTALTRLALGKLTKGAPHAAASSTGQQPGPAQPPSSAALPAQLVALELCEAVNPLDLLELQHALEPLKHLWLGGLVLQHAPRAPNVPRNRNYDDDDYDDDDDDDEDEDDDEMQVARLEAQLQLALQPAYRVCELIAQRFDQRLVHRHFTVQLDLEDPREKGYASPGGYRHLIFALRPLRLRRLAIDAPVFDEADVAELARSLPNLEDLKLHCVTSGALSTLRRLKKLQRLRVQVIVPVWDSPPSCRCLLKLCRSLPHLHSLCVCVSVNDGECFGSQAMLASEALECRMYDELKENLQKLQAKLPNVVVEQL